MTEKTYPMAAVSIIDAGLTSPIGRTWPTVLGALQSGQSGLAYEEIHGYPTAIGRVRAEISLDSGCGFQLDRGVGLALDCVRQLQPLPELDARRCAVFWGVGIAGAHWLENSYQMYCADGDEAKTSPWTIPMIMPNAAAALIAERLGLRGGAWTQASACASSAMAIGQAFQAIRSGTLDMAVVGGSDAMLTPGILHAWARMRVLARTAEDVAQAACKPFDVQRNGLCLAEGAACLVLMNSNLAQAMNVKSLAEIHGWGHCCDAFDLTVPCASGQAQAIRLALDDASIKPSDVSYVCAHATGTRKGDITELQALQVVWSGCVPVCPVSSIKSALGHTMAASGALASVLTVAMLHSNWWAPTLHLNTADDFCHHWKLPAKKGITINGDGYALVNAFGFGGSNACLIFKR